jgi:hypothetical protein
MAAPFYRRAEVGDVEILATIARVLGADAARTVLAELPILDAEDALRWALERADRAPRQVRH